MSLDISLPNVEELSEEIIDKIENTKNKKKRFCFYCGRYINNRTGYFIWFVKEKTFAKARFCTKKHAKSFILETFSDENFDKFLNDEVKIIYTSEFTDEQYLELKKLGVQYERRVC